MLKTVNFRKLDRRLHLSIKAESTLSNVNIGTFYNEAMDEFTRSMRVSKEPAGKFNNFIPIDESARVEGIDSDIYTEFKVTCLQQDLTIGTGINLALKNWLESRDGNSSQVGKRI